MAAEPDFPSTVAVSTLDQHHYETFRAALSNILSTDLAESTMAQLVDGLPTIDVHLECGGISNLNGHPIRAHKTLCEGALERIRKLRSDFDPSNLSLKSSTIQSFQSCTLGSREFDLRLLELLAEAIHVIAVFLFNLEEKSHNGNIESVVSYRQPDRTIEILPGDWVTFKSETIPYPTLFTFPAYNWPEQYPNGLADVAAYWAEDRIFGGVLIFDRGESGKECNDVYLHSNRVDWTMRVWSLTASQFEQLMEFLKTDSPDENRSSPFPLCADKDNAHRFDDYDAMKWHNIYRDPWERKLPETKNWEAIRMNTFDYPELRSMFRAVAESEMNPEPKNDTRSDAERSKLQSGGASQQGAEEDSDETDNEEYISPCAGLTF